MSYNWIENPDEVLFWIFYFKGGNSKDLWGKSELFLSGTRTVSILGKSLFPYFTPNTKINSKCVKFILKIQ